MSRSIATVPPSLTAPRQWPRGPVLLAAALAGLVLAAGAAPLFAQQTPPPRPRPKPPPSQSSPAQPSQSRNTPPPPPVLLVTADRDCTLRLDGIEVATLQKNQVRSLDVEPGEHLMQAFPLDVDGPTWTGTVRVPETGQVVSTIGLEAVVEAYLEEQRQDVVVAKTVERFTAKGPVVTDNQNGLTWYAVAATDLEWEEARAYCGALSVDGVTGWRVPTLQELSTLYYPEHPAPQQGTIKPDAFNPVQVVPILIRPAFESNRCSQLWTADTSGRKALRCTFLREFDCEGVGKGKDGDVLCVRP